MLKKIALKITKRFVAEDTQETLFRVLGYFSQSTSLILIVALGFLLYAITEPGFAVLMEYFIRALEGESSEMVYLVPLATIGIAFVRGLGSYLGNYYLAKLSLGVTHRIRTEVFNRILDLPMTFFEKQDTGHLISKITYNVEQIAGTAVHSMRVVFREGLTLVALLCYLLWSNWQLTAVFFVMFPMISFAVNKATKKFRAISTQVQESVGDITHSITEAVRNIVSVKSFSAEVDEKQHFSAASDDNRRHSLRMSRNQAIFVPVIQLMIIAGLAAIMWLVLLMREGSSPAELVAFVTAVGMLPRPIRQLSEVTANIQKGLVAAKSVFEILDMQIESNGSEKRIEKVEGNIEVKNLNFCYPGTDTRVLKDINFSIKPGQKVAFVGGSGSGKSTMAKLITRFYQAPGESIFLDNHDLSELSVKEVRKNISLVDQSISLFKRSVRDNIAYGELKNTDDSSLQMSIERSQCKSFIENLELGVDTILSEDGTSLSGGQRQRLILARALLKSAPILILDEATSALDSKSEKKFQQALEEVLQGKTSIIIAHRLSTISDADCIFVFDNGEIVEQGTHQQMIENKSYYYNLCHAQNMV